MSLLELLPKKGVDAEYDSLIETALLAMTQAGVPFSEDDVRLSVGQFLADQRGYPLETAFGPHIEDDGDGEVRFEALLAAIAGGGDDVFWEEPDTTKFIDTWIEARQRIRNVGAIISVGPTGTGKTEGLIRAATKRGIPVFVQHCSTITSSEKWFGHKEIDENGTRYEKSEFIKHVEGLERPPGLLIFDEITRVHPHLHGPLFSLLDGQGQLHIPELSEMITVHPNVMFAATANMGSGYGGTFTMDVALMDRFSYTIRRDFPPTDAEVEILMKRTGVTKDKAERMVWAATRTRQMWRADELQRPISTRLLLAWGTLVSLGMPIAKAAEYSIMSQYRDDGENSDVTKVKQIVQGKAANK